MLGGLALANAPEYDPDGQAKCAIKKSQSEPLIIEWPATQRAKLEAIASRGAIAVRYDGCEMEVMGGCKIPRAYDYTATTRQREHVSIKDEDELYARLPLGAARLQANLEKAGELNVSMTIVGTFETDRSRVHRDELKGDCGRATHVVDALIVGAFEFYAGAEAGIGAGAEVGNVGAGAKSSTKRSMLRAAGEEKACKKSSDRDKSPPDGCGALLRVEVTRIARARPRSYVAPPEPTTTARRPHEPPPRPRPTATAPRPSSTALAPPPSATARQPKRAKIPKFTKYTAGSGWGFEAKKNTWIWWVIGGVGGAVVVATVIGSSVAAAGSSDPATDTGEGFGSKAVGLPGVGSPATPALVVQTPVLRW